LLFLLLTRRQLEDLNQGSPLLPSDPKTRAHSRLWTDHINRKIIPHFYSYLQAQEPEKQAEEATAFRDEIEKLVKAAHAEGPFFLGSELSFVDIQFAPWVIRLNRVLKPYRGWPEPEPGSRWAKWIAAIEGDGFVKATTSGEELYLDSYERYAGEYQDSSGMKICFMLMMRDRKPAEHESSR
jgi:glutathione S-transferase